MTGVPTAISYVQDKQSERGRNAFDLEQLTRQISRADETRSASQFVADEQRPKKATGGGGASRPRLSGPNRYDALKEAAKALAQRVSAPVMGVVADLRAAAKATTGTGTSGATRPPAPISATPADPMLEIMRKIAAGRATPSAGKYDDLKPQQPETERPPGLMGDFVKEPTREEVEARRKKESERDKGKGRDL